MITTRHKEKTLSKLIKELDTVFSLFIRLRDSNEQGTVTCFVSGEKVFWKDSDASHFIGRASMATRYHEQNVHACTKDSNQYDQDHNDKYIFRMMQRYGMTFVSMLKSQSKSLQKFTRPELTEMIEEYKVKVAELKRLKGL